MIVLAAKGTVMPMVGRRGEWIQMQLSPEMRKTATAMRRYRNESSGKRAGEGEHEHESGSDDRRYP